MAKFKQVREATKYNPYAIGMSVVKKKMGLGPEHAHGLPKAAIVKAHDIAKKIKANEEFDSDLEEAISLPDNPDYSKYDKATFLRNKPMETPKQAPKWVGKNTDKPAYKRKAEAEGK
jgi:hypothetical protein